MFFLEILKVVFLGIVEGVTEWLPISSTGHMILVDEFIKLDVSRSFMEMFLVVIQLGAIIAVVILYYEKLNPFSRRKNILQKRDTFDLWCKVVVACVPAAIIGLKYNDLMDELFYNYQTVACTLIIYGVLFIIVETCNKRRRPRITSLAELDYKSALLIGLFQVLSLVPGTSRSGATIVGGISIGVSRYVATEFTFFLAIPVMFGASLLKIIKFGFDFTHDEIIILLTGMVTALLTSIVAIKFLVGYIKKNDFKSFGYYRILLGLMVLGYFYLVK